MSTPMRWIVLQEEKERGSISSCPWLHHPYLLGVPMVGRDHNGCITPAFLGSPWWGELNLEKSGCGGDEEKIWKRVEMGETG